MIKNLNKLLCIILLVVPNILFGKTINYLLSSDLTNPKIAMVSVDTSNIGTFILEESRQLPFSNDIDTSKIQCMTSSGKKTVKYGTEINCKRLTWSINFDILSEHGTDVSLQKNLYSKKGWWLLFEWGDIPRLKGYSNINICVNQLKAESQNTCRILPTKNSAPLILVWGVHTAQNNSLKTQFKLYVDNSSRVLKDGAWTQLLSQFNYLQSLLLKGGKEKKDIDIVWIGNDESIGALGGAAGSQSYISNYAIKNNLVSFEDLSRLYWISGHEQFHMLSSYSFPIWISESLAHYYGYKSLSNKDFLSQSPVDVWGDNMHKTLYSNIGLYSANEKVAVSKDMSYYGLFYDKGAAFWHELDNELMKKGSNLDLFIGFLDNKDKSIAKLNDPFVTAIEQIIGREPFIKLVSKYLL